jgi:N-dimethylarginine dimethylaminohydrolase
MTVEPHILMCPPQFYGVEYEINPWMNRERKVQHDLAIRQWNDLQQTLLEAGAQISLLPPVQGLPDLVFTANAAMIYRDLAILSRFRHPQRQGEEEHNERWLSAHGFAPRRLPETFYFEGAGDALFCGDTLFAGYRFRSDAGGHQAVGQMVGHRVIPLELVDPYYYHLDTCFCPLATGVAAYFPGAFDNYGRQVLDQLVSDLIEVDEQEARRFACNAVVVGKTVVTNDGCPRLQHQLRARQFEPREVPLSEFVKAGGSAKCLTLRLDGEDAASWKHESQSTQHVQPLTSAVEIRRQTN